MPTHTHTSTHTSELHLQQVAIVFSGGRGKNAKWKKFPGCPSLSYQSVICARRPPSSAAIWRQHPGPQDAAGNTAGHRERCDNVSGYSRRRTLSLHVCAHEHSHTHTLPERTWSHKGYTDIYSGTHTDKLHRKTQRLTPSDIAKLSHPHKTDTRNTDICEALSYIVIN